MVFLCPVILVISLKPMAANGNKNSSVDRIKGIFVKFLDCPTRTRVSLFSHVVDVVVRDF